MLRGAVGHATLKVSGWRSRAAATLAGEDYELQLSGLRDRGASARRAGQSEPIVRISRKACVLPAGIACEWMVKTRWRGYEGTLHANQLGQIDLRLGRGSRSEVVAIVSGTWPDRDLVVTAAFALLARRREDATAAAS